MESAFALTMSAPAAPPRLVIDDTYGQSAFQDAFVGDNEGDRRGIHWSIVHDYVRWLPS